MPTVTFVSPADTPCRLDPGFILRLRPNAVTAERFKLWMLRAVAKIPVQSSVDILTTLDEAEIMAGASNLYPPGCVI